MMTGQYFKKEDAFEYIEMRLRQGKLFYIICFLPISAMGIIYGIFSIFLQIEFNDMYYNYNRGIAGFATLLIVLIVDALAFIVYNRSRKRFPIDKKEVNSILAKYDAKEMISTSKLDPIFKKETNYEFLILSFASFIVIFSLMFWVVSTI
jgi:hypothetical protein